MGVVFVQVFHVTFVLGVVIAKVTGSQHQMLISVQKEFLCHCHNNRYEWSSGPIDVPELTSVFFLFKTNQIVDVATSTVSLMGMFRFFCQMMDCSPDFILTMNNGRLQITSDQL